jgi:YebC/PmpR family DNA-binding regulatory protein
MAGHSKWANIKHRKEKADAQKGKIFSRIAKEIISAVKLGGPDPKANTRLKLAIQKAKEANMPSENIERNIKKASSADQANFENITYEIYGYGGVGILADAMTDNKNRTASDIRIAINKRGGTMATPNSVAFNFDRRGVIQIDKSAGEEDKLLSLAIEAGAEDFEGAPEGYFVVTEVSLLYAIKESLELKGIVTVEAEIEMIPKNTIECDEEARVSNLALIEWLEGIDDVNSVYHNMDLSS